MSKSVSILRQLYWRLYGGKSQIKNWGKLAGKLGEFSGKNWSGRYMRSIANGDKGFKVTGEINMAAEKLADIVGISDEPVVVYEPGVVSIHNLPPGTLILGNAKECRYSECGIIFVPEWGNQLYHCKDCSRLARNQRRRNDVKKKAIAKHRKTQG